MSNPFNVRRATADDAATAFDILLPAVRDLTARQGIAWDPDPAAMRRDLAPLFDHLAAHAAEWWIAEDVATRQPIGYARSVDRDGLFELSEFFVLPDRQSAGVGAALLGCAFPEGRGSVRVIIATTDVRAQARYYRAGTVTRFPIMSVEGSPRPAGSPSAAGSPVTPPGLEIREADESDIPSLVALDRAVLEFDRGDDFRWLLAEREGYLYRRAGTPIGYAFLGVTGTGPIAALDPGDQVVILEHVERRATELRIETLSLEVPSVNEVAIRHLLGRGFRIDPFLTLLMSSRPFGRFDRYVAFGPPFVL